MTTYPEFTLAAVQAASVLFDRDAAAEKACRLIAEAAGQGATLAAFGETWLRGYPDSVWPVRPARVAGGGRVPRQRRRDPQLDDRPALRRRPPRRDRRGDRDSRVGPPHPGTVYCTLLFIGREGKILGRHRKLKPTHAGAHGLGRGRRRGLAVHDRPYGRDQRPELLGAPDGAPGYALMAQGTQIHIAAWPGPPGRRRHRPNAVSGRPPALLVAGVRRTGRLLVVVVAEDLRLAERVPERLPQPPPRRSRRP